MTAFANGYDYRRLLTVDPTKANESITGFVTLIDYTDASLKLVANGGHVHKNPLLDIRFEDLSGNKLPHEIQVYDGTTGHVTAWVRLDLTSSSQIYVYYGKDLAWGDVDNTSDGTWSGMGATGIKVGYGDGTLMTFERNSKGFNSGANNGELMVHALALYDPNGVSKTITYETRLVPGQESGASQIPGWLMYHTPASNSRFTATGWNTSWSDTFKNVRYSGGNWQYDNNSAWTNFTPDPDDMLVARTKAAYTGGYAVVSPLRAGEEDLVAVWSWQDWKAVWHLDNTPFTSSTYPDQPDVGWYSSSAGSEGGMNSADVVPGIAGTALDLDGVNDYISVSMSGAAIAANTMDNTVNSIADVMAGSTDFSISGWFKTSDTTKSKLLLAINTGTGGNVMLLWMKANGTVGIAGQGADSFGTTQWNDGQWHMFCYSRAGASQSLYVDGVGQTFRSSYNYTLSNTDRWSFGQEWDTDNPSGLFPGAIDEYRVHSRGSTNSRMVYFQNQKYPGIFWSMGTEESIVPLTQTGNARIERVESLTQPGNSRIERIEPLTQIGSARIEKSVQLTQQANARIQRTETLNQPASAQITRIDSLDQVGNALIESFYFEATIDQSGNARIQRTETISQVGNARLAKAFTIDQVGNAFIQWQLQLQQPANARIERIFTVTQSGNAAIMYVGHIDQSGHAIIERIESLSIVGNAKISNPSPDKRPQQWEDASTEQPAEWQDSDQTQEQQWSDTDNKQPTEWRRQFYD